MFRELVGKRKRDYGTGERRIVAGKEVCIVEDPNGGVGGSIWAANRLFFTYLTSSANLLSGTAIELGSGTGMLGIRLGMEMVTVVTDLFDMIPLLEHNIGLNPDAEVQACELDWNQPVTQLSQNGVHLGSVTLVVAVECLYNLKNGPALFDIAEAIADRADAPLHFILAFANRQKKNEHIFISSRVSRWKVISDLTEGDHQLVHLQYQGKSGGR